MPEADRLTDLNRCTALLVDIRDQMDGLRRDIGDVRKDIALLRADLPSIVTEAIAPFFKN